MIRLEFCVVYANWGIVCLCRRCGYDEWTRSEISVPPLNRSDNSRTSVPHKVTHCCLGCLTKRGHALTPAQRFDHKWKNLNLRQDLGWPQWQCRRFRQGVKNVWLTFGNNEFLYSSQNFSFFRVGLASGHHGFSQRQCHSVRADAEYATLLLS